MIVYKNVLAIQRILLWPIFQLVYILLFIIYFQLVPSIFQLFLGTLSILTIEGIGLSICLHRYFAHTAFKTSRIFQFVLGFFGHNYKSWSDIMVVINTQSASCLL